MNTLLRACAMIVLLLTPIWAQAECREAQWPYSRKQSHREMRQLLDRLPRDTIVAFLYGELAHPVSDTVAPQLLEYLRLTETSPLHREKFKMLREAAGLDSRRSKGVLTLKAICELEERAKAQSTSR